MTNIILSVCIPYRPDRDFSFLLKQDWLNCECILVAEKTDMDENYSLLVDQLQQVVNLVCVEENPNSTWENDGLKKATGTFWVSLNPYQTWGSDFLHQIKTTIGQYFVDEKLPARFTKSDSEPYFHNFLLYAMGYVEEQGQTRFCTEVYPFLQKKSSIVRNFFRPEVFLSCNSFIYPTKLIHDNNLQFNKEISSSILRHAIFGIDVLAAMFVLNNQREPQLKGVAASVIAPLNTFSSKSDLQVYQDHMLEKWQIWEKRWSSKLCWISKIARISKKSRQKQHLE